MISTKFRLSGIAQEVARTRARADQLSEACARIPVEPCFVPLITLVTRTIGEQRHAAAMLEAAVEYYRAAHELRTGFPPEAERPNLRVVAPDEPE